MPALGPQAHLGVTPTPSRCSSKVSFNELKGRLGSLGARVPSRVCSMGLPITDRGSKMVCAAGNIGSGWKGMGTAQGSGFNPGQNGTGRGSGEEEAMVSMEEMQNMLAGLKSSLKSIEDSRAEYARLLAERDDYVLQLQEQLQEKQQEVAELDLRLQESESELQSARATAQMAQDQAAEATRLAAEAQAQVQQQAVEIAQAAAAAQAAQQAVLAVAAQQQQQQASKQPPPQQQQPTWPASPPPPNNPSRGAPSTEVVLYYRTGWKQVYVHCNMDDKGWTNAPGIAMDTATDQLKVARLPCKRLEFVMTNGKGEWDSPPTNYSISSPGSYRLENGNLSRLG